MPRFTIGEFGTIANRKKVAVWADFFVSGPQGQLKGGAISEMGPMRRAGWACCGAMGRACSGVAMWVRVLRVVEPISSGAAMLVPI